MEHDQRYETVTDENFEESLYLAANPDIARHKERGGDVWDHFDRHGRHEGRKQLTPAAGGLPGDRRTRKYQRFERILDPSHGLGGRFRFLNGLGCFPVAYGGNSSSLSDYDAEAANPGLGDFVEHVQANPDKLFLDVGCGRRDRTFDNCLYLEVYPSKSADIIMEPACNYPIADSSLDGIGCFAVMEHMTEPWTAAAEFARMLKPGGLVFIDYPFMVPVHGYPSHYFNATREGLLSLFRGSFDVVKLNTGENQTPDHSLHWQLTSIVNALTDTVVRNELEELTVRELLAQAPGSYIWRRVIAALPEQVRADYAAGNTLIGCKRYDGPA